MTTEVRARRSAARAAALVFGVAFLLVGVLGFVPGITAGYADLRFAGHESGARLFGVFTVSVLHNLVHLAFGVLGVVASRGQRRFAGLPDDRRRDLRPAVRASASR